jgi:hypothetical protein
VTRRLDRTESGDDWRVEVDLDDERHGYSLGERLSAVDLDDEARQRLDGRVLVTRNGAKLFLYAGSRERAREAARVMRELLRSEQLTAELRITRWHADGQTWERAAVRLPRTETERADERKRLEERTRLEVEEGASYDWIVQASVGDRAAAVELEQRLRGRQLPVERHWRYVLVDALTEEQADEIASLVLELASEAEVAVEPIIHATPSYVLARTFF